jgi:hypothetical protein
MCKQFNQNKCILIMISKAQQYIKKHDDILSWKLWSEFKSFGSFQLWTTLLFTIIFYLPFVGRGVKSLGFLHFGDNIQLWIPQLFNTYLLNNALIFQGIDFFTHGGASEYFLRPNILTYNPIVLFFSYIAEISSMEHMLIFCFALYVLHSFIACLFAQKLCSKFLHFDKYLSLFVGVSFAFSLFLINNLGFLPFFLISCLIPACIYSLLLCHKNFGIFQILMASFTAILIYTSGYLILSVFLISASCVFCIFYLYINNQLKISHVSRIFVPLILSGIIILPLYWEILSFHHIVKPFTTGLEGAAHNLGTNPNILLRLLSNSLSFGLGEQQSIAVGMIPFLIIIMYIFSFKKDAQTKIDLNNKLATFCFTLIGIIFLTCLGVYSPFSYLMYITPIFGKTHLYVRYLIPLTLFLFIGLGILLNTLSTKYNESVCKKILLILLATFLFLTASSYLKTDAKALTDGYFIFELILAIIFPILFLIVKKKNTIIFLTTILIFLNSLNWFHRLSYISILQSKELFHEQVVLKNFGNTNKLINYFNDNSNKEIIKIIDFTPNFHGIYLSKNMPWLLQDKIKISSYGGYEPHLARDLNFTSEVNLVAPGGQYHIDPKITWLKQTKAEFIIFNKNFINNDTELLKYADMSRALTLPHNTTIAPLNFQEPKNTRFNNGYIRVLSQDPNTQITQFDTNHANYLRFHSTAEQGTTIQYLFWPNKHMTPYIDGLRAKFKKIDGLNTLRIPSGEHEIKILYENTLLDIFLALYFGYLGLCVITVIYILTPKQLIKTYKKAYIITLVSTIILLGIIYN